MFALYIGGMGARGRNFYNTVFARQGYPDEAKLVQDLYLDGRKDEAAAALPDDFVERATLIGPPGFVRERIAALREAGITHLHVNPVGARRPEAARPGQGVDLGIEPTPPTTTLGHPATLPRDAPDRQECPLLDLAVAVSDPPVTPGQYRYVETHAWWLGTLRAAPVPRRAPAAAVGAGAPGAGLAAGARADRRAAPGSPARPRQAREDGFDLRDVAPDRPVPGPHGAFDADAGDEHADDDAATLPPTTGGGRAAARRHAAARELAVTDRRVLPAAAARPGSACWSGCVEDNPGSWFSPFAAAVTALRTGLVPAALRGRAVPGADRPARRSSVAEHMPNIDGRDCLALVHDAGRTRTELMIDPSDGQFAGERDTLRADSRCGLPAGTVISTTAVRVAVVDRAGLRPECPDLARTGPVALAASSGVRYRPRLSGD